MKMMVFPLSPTLERMTKQRGICRLTWKMRKPLCCPLLGILTRISFECRGRVGGEGLSGALRPETQGSISLMGPHAQAPDLQRIHKRIQDIVGVLRDFGAQREEGRSRTEYLHRLQKDLATYYSYGDFLLGKLMELFPLSEVRCLRCFPSLCASVTPLSPSQPGLSSEALDSV